MSTHTLSGAPQLFQRQGTSGAKGALANHVLTVPEGATDLVVRVSGHIDLDVTQGTTMTQQSWDCRPFAAGHTETCTMNAPASGSWSLLIHGWSAFADARIEAFTE